MAGTMSQLKTSRIFVKNLPITRFTEKDLREHFSKFSDITDCRYYPNRHIAFIGYRNAHDAEAAAGYFDKSYIRTSKLAVELAKSIKEESRTTKTRVTSLRQGEHSKPYEKQETTIKNLKRKRDKVEGSDHKRRAGAAESDPKLKEYLALSQRSRNLKTWENDLQTGNDTMPQEDLSSLITHEPIDDGSDDEYVNIPKRRGQPPGVPSTEAGNSFQSEGKVTQTADGAIDDGNHDVVMVDEDPADDADWLRSRQNRTLDLDMGDAPVKENEEDSSVEDSSLQNAVAQTSTLENTSTREEDIQPKAPKFEPEPEPDTERDLAIKDILKTGRLFVRNLYYSCTEEDLKNLFGPFGELEEVHISVDSKTSKSKGMAFILFKTASDAVSAYESLDGEIFQGRSLHVLPGKPKKTEKLDDFELAKLPLKRQREILKKRQAAKADFEWNSLYMNIDSVITSTAKSLGISKADMLDPTSSDAVVRQAQAETRIIQETKSYFEAQGVNLTAFSKQQRGDSVLLIKNFPFGTTADELKSLLAEYGDVRRVMMPPAGTIAIAEFANDPSGRAALASLYGRKFKDSVLKLEKGPKDLFTKLFAPDDSKPNAVKEAKVSAQDFLEVSTEEFPDTTSLYVKNLNFSTTRDDIRNIFEPLSGFLSARVQTKPDPKNPGMTLSQGYGFVEFKTKEDADAAHKAMNGFVLQGYKLNIQPARKDEDSERQRAAKANTQKKTKIIIKNLAFEVTEKQVKALFSKYGKLRSVRIPKKFNRSTRGFGFADFFTSGDAANALEALKHTHLHGRPLVLEWAKEDSKNAEEEIQRLTKKASKQVNNMKMAQLTSSATRKKSDIRKLVEGGEEEV